MQEKLAHKFSYPVIVSDNAFGKVINIFLSYNSSTKSRIHFKGIFI